MGLGLGRLLTPSRSWFPWTTSATDSQDRDGNHEKDHACLENPLPSVSALDPFVAEASVSSRYGTSLSQAPHLDSSSLGSFNLLLDLHSPLDECILNEWLEMRDLPNLDIAFCNRQLRPVFLTLFRCRQLRAFQADQLEIPSQFSAYLDWIVARSVQTKLLAADRLNWKIICEPKYRSILEKLEVLGVGCGNADVRTVFPVRSLDFCPNIFALILINVNAFAKMKAGQRLTKLQKLKALSVLQSTITAQHLVILLQHAPELQCLMLNHCALTMQTLYVPALTQIGRRIKWLQLLKCDQMRDTDIQLLLSLCTNLEYLKISRENGFLFLNSVALAEEDEENDEQFHTQTDADSENTDRSRDNDPALPRYLTSKALATIDFEGLRYMRDADFLSILRGSASAITDLNLSVCRLITNRSLKYIANHCPQLKSLMISFTEVTDDGLYQLARRCHKLETLQLYGCPNVTDTGLLSLQPLAPSLLFISVSECPRVTESGVISMLQALQRLEKLCLTQYEPSAKYTDEVLTHIGLHSSSLRTLLLTNLMLISSTAVQAMLRRCGRSLTWLDISRNGSAVTNDVLQIIGQHCHKLTLLDISFCTQVTDTGLQALAVQPGAMPCLQELHVQSCPQLSAQSLVQILQHCSAIQKINCTGCTGELSEEHCALWAQRVQTDAVLRERSKDWPKIWAKGQVLYRRIRPDRFFFTNPFT